jgi:hypothetical protein
MIPTVDMVELITDTGVEIMATMVGRLNLEGVNPNTWGAISIAKAVIRDSGEINTSDKVGTRVVNLSTVLVVDMADLVVVGHLFTVLVVVTVDPRVVGHLSMVKAVIHMVVDHRAVDLTAVVTVGPRVVVTVVDRKAVVTAGDHMEDVDMFFMSKAGYPSDTWLFYYSHSYYYDTL